MYRGREIVVTLYGPDLLAFVDGQQCGQFWLNVGAAQKAAEQHIDQVEKEKRT